MRLVFNPFTGTFDWVRRAGEGRKIGVILLGDIDGMNKTFTTPTNFIHMANGETIAVYYNGQRLLGGGEDYTPKESGGSGMGYDTVVLEVAPKPSSGPPDRVTADYTEK